MLLQIIALDIGSVVQVVSIFRLNSGCNCREIDSDGDEMEELADSEDSTLKGYRLWYAVDILVEPAPPEKILDISCPCLVGLLLLVTSNAWP